MLYLVWQRRLREHLGALRFRIELLLFEVAAGGEE